MTEATWTERFSEAMMGSLAPPMAVLVRGEGCYVWDEAGKKYLDFLAGIAVNSLGHAHPVLVDAVAGQIATLAHISNYFASPSQIELAERLRRISGAGDLWVSECTITYDGVPSFSVSIMEFTDGYVTHETQYFGDEFEAAQWRAPLAEPIPSDNSEPGESPREHPV